jgi:hypothetical protein
MSGRIFISYRRQDSAGYAGRLFDRLSNRFGQSNIFMDIDAIELGVDFVQRIQEAVGSCDVLLAVIGPSWLAVTNTNGQPRLSDPNDFVRVEVLTALQRDIRVIPLLVQGAHMPNEKELPAELTALARRNGMGIEHASFDSDVNLLVTKLEKILGETTPSREDAQADPEEEWDFEEDDYEDKFVPPPNLPQSLQTLLPGTWLVNINMPTPFGMIPMQMNVEVRMNGTFQGVSPTLMVQGQWNISPLQQLVLTGQQSNGMQVAPYNVVIQFTQLSSDQLSGFTSGSEVTVWDRVAGKNW